MNNLPHVLKSNVVSFLTLFELISIRRVSKNYKIISEKNPIWKGSPYVKEIYLYFLNKINNNTKTWISIPDTYHIHKRNSVPLISVNEKEIELQIVRDTHFGAKFIIDQKNYIDDSNYKFTIEFNVKVGSYHIIHQFIDIEVNLHNPSYEFTTIGQSFEFNFQNYSINFRLKYDDRFYAYMAGYSNQQPMLIIQLPFVSINKKFLYQKLTMMKLKKCINNSQA